MSAALAMQIAVRDRLVGWADVTALVLADNIVDINSRPSPDPAIIIGEGQALEYGDIARGGEMVFLDLHVWKKETGLEGVKAITGAIRAAVHASRPALDGYHCGDCRVTAMRFMRDPDGETAHGVVTVEALVNEAAS